MPPPGPDRQRHQVNGLAVSHSPTMEDMMPVEYSGTKRAMRRDACHRRDQKAIPNDARASPKISRRFEFDQSR